MNKNRHHKPPKKIDDFIRYSSLAFEMAAIIALGTFAGVKLDDWIQTSFPYFTISLSIIFVISSIYHAIKRFL